MSPRTLFSSNEIITALERAGFVARKSQAAGIGW